MKELIIITMKTFLIIIGILLLAYYLRKRWIRSKITKYASLISLLNQYAFQSRGTPTFINNRKLQIYKTDSPQILYFELNENGDLLIEWRYKYYQQEMIFKDTFYRCFLDFDDTVRPEEVSYYKRIAMEAGVNNILKEFNKKLDIHKKTVDSKGIPEEMLSEFGVSSQNLKIAREELSGMWYM